MKTMNTTQTTANHTPVPWVVTTDNRIFHRLDHVASCADTAQGDANAEFIARAVNSHEGLLDIARRWMEWATGPVVPIAVLMTLQDDTRAAISSVGTYPIRTLALGSYPSNKAEKREIGLGRADRGKERVRRGTYRFVRSLVKTVRATILTAIRDTARAEGHTS